MSSLSEVFVCLWTMKMERECKLSAVLRVLMALLCHKVHLKI
jgi:hypothetical protein